MNISQPDEEEDCRSSEHEISVDLLTFMIPRKPCSSEAKSTTGATLCDMRIGTTSDASLDLPPSFFGN
ncbi:unnamed protein product [Lampetra fluviatilis]